MDIASANYENKISNQESVKKQAVFISNKYENEDLVDAHRVTPLSPKKTNKDCPVTPLNQVIQDHGVTPLDHGTTPVKEHSELDSGKENKKPETEQLVRTESMSLRYSYSNNTFASCNSFADLYSLAAANATPSSPNKNNGSTKGRSALFPSHCITHQESSALQAR